MKHVILTTACFLIFSLSASSQTADTTALPTATEKAVPIQLGGQIPIHKFATQAEFLLGTAQIIRGDKPRASFTAAVKGIYSLTGAIYLSSGLGLGWLHSESRAPVIPDVREPRYREVVMASLPSGIGFTMGDDRAAFFSGIDVTPTVYLRTPDVITDPRKVAIGFSPEFGFLFKAGRYNQKGVQIGMLGRVNFLQPASRSGGSMFRYASAGAGLVIRFY